MGEERGWYDTALICLNGHVTNAEFNAHPERNTKYCAKCGEATITKCQRCEADIRGTYQEPGQPYWTTITVPSFCHNCGLPYPWVERRLKAARDYAHEIAELSDEDKNVLDESLDELVKDSPQTDLAATRFKRLMAKVGREAAETFRKLLVDIVSETAKKVIWGQ